MPAASIPVTIDSFARAETDLYFGNIVRDSGIGKFFHNREPTPLDKQVVIRMNRDTLYSSAVFDLDAGAGHHHPARCRKPVHVHAGMG